MLRADPGVDVFFVLTDIYHVDLGSVQVDRHVKIFVL